VGGGSVVTAHDGRRIVVVGASAAGLRCACRLARLCPTWRIRVVEEREKFSYAACGIPYVLSGDIAGADELRRTMDGVLRDPHYFSAVKGIEVLAGRRAVGVAPATGALTVADAHGGVEELAWDELVLACGGRARRLAGQVEHPRVRSLHTLEDLEPLESGLRTGQIRSVTVVGAGPLGCEVAEAFRSLWGAAVTLVEQAAWPLPGVLDAEAGSIVASVLEDNGVVTRFAAPVERFEAKGEEVVVHAGGEALAADLVVVAAGVEPCTELASAAGIRLGPTGAIAVDERLATSLPHVWAVGDCVEVRHAVTGAPVHLPLGSLANRQGRVLANVLAGRDDRFPPVAGAMAVKVFDCNVGAVGLTLAAARRHGFDAAAVWVVAHDRAHYWPEAQELALQLVYDRPTGRVLGVQGVGTGEVMKRVDVATQFLARGATIEELAALEHAYAPPYAPALEPLAVAAFVACNQEEGVEAVSPLAELEGARVLDVRHEAERRGRSVTASELLSIPLEELRGYGADRLQGPLLVVCERGGRSAEAVRYLRQRGVGSRYLGGGLRWSQVGRGRGGR
jgi:NADPH-dependent 2,4-dienoyl-CoA reductase/sulfur reductase-like enzyme/rhodanese-related sulfurtransferase